MSELTLDTPVDAEMDKLINYVTIYSGKRMTEDAAMAYLNKDKNYIGLPLDLQDIFRKKSDLGPAPPYLPATSGGKRRRTRKHKSKRY